MIKSINLSCNPELIYLKYIYIFISHKNIVYYLKNKLYKKIFLKIFYIIIEFIMK